MTLYDMGLFNANSKVPWRKKQTSRKSRRLLQNKWERDGLERGGDRGGEGVERGGGDAMGLKGGGGEGRTLAASVACALVYSLYVTSPRNSIARESRAWGKVHCRQGSQQYSTIR